MKDIIEIVDSIESKLKKLIKKIEVLEQYNLELMMELKKKSVIINDQSNDLVNLKHQLQTLKTTNSLLGSNENTKDTKLRINSLIRDINHCIIQLSN